MVFNNKIQTFYFLLLGLCGALFVLAAVNAQGEESAEARVAQVMKKYSTIIDHYSSKETIQKYIDKGDDYAKRYTDEQFLDHLINAEEYRKKDQQAFNDTILYQFNIPLNDQLTPISLCNGDLGKMLFVLLEWGNEWHLYRNMLNFWTDFSTDQMMLQRKEYIDALQAMQDSIDNHDDKALEKATDQIHKLVFDTGTNWILGKMTRELLPSIGINIALDGTFQSLKKHFLLDQLQSENILTVLATSLCNVGKIKHYHDAAQSQPSMFELVEKEWFSNLPLTILKTGVLDQVNGLLQDHGLLPKWTTENTYHFTKRIAFMLLFMRWSIQSFLQPKLFEVVMKKHQLLLEILQSTDDNKPLLKNMLSQGHKSSFTLWLGLKSEKYTSWQTVLNLVMIVPAIVVLAQKLYTMIQQPGTQNDGNLQQLTDNGGAI